MNELDQLLADLGAARTKTGNAKPASPVKNSTAQPKDQSTEETNADGSDEHLDVDFAPLGAVPCVKYAQMNHVGDDWLDKDTTLLTRLRPICRNHLSIVNHASRNTVCPCVTTANPRYPPLT
ncbi:hypothetical protein HDU85_001861 [Gaertneriomyces sp. JEL0708]|nr:hypothetical protein HDU85_001861 [Gaertneriomyces sp. JEL0708]